MNVKKSVQKYFAFCNGILHTKTFCRATRWRQQVTFIIVDRNKTKTVWWKKKRVFCKLLAISTCQNMWNNVRRNRFLTYLKQQSHLKMQTDTCISITINYTSNFAIAKVFFMNTMFRTCLYKKPEPSTSSCKRAPYT